jgi:hypothetical protein
MLVSAKAFSPSTVTSAPAISSNGTSPSSAKLLGISPSEVAYVGSKATHLGDPDANINQLTPEQLAIGAPLLTKVPNPFFGTIPASSSIGQKTTTNAQLLKPFPEFTNVTFFRNNIGNSNYNAVQAKIEKRFSRGLAVLFSYTRSKLIDDASSVFDSSIFTGPIANYPVANAFDRGLDRERLRRRYPQRHRHQLDLRSPHRPQPSPQSPRHRR